MTMTESENQVLFDPGAYQVPTEAKVTVTGGAPVNLFDPTQAEMLSKLEPGGFYTGRFMFQVESKSERYRGMPEDLNPQHVIGLRVHEIVEVEDNQ